MTEFMTIDDLGCIRVDTVLFEGNFPILFTCLDEAENLYICVCCQDNYRGRKWLLTKTTPGLVVKMLCDRITIREVFERFPAVQYSILEDEAGRHIRKGAKEDWGAGSKNLPEADEYMEAEEGEFEEEIAHYREMEARRYGEDQFETAYSVCYSAQGDRGYMLEETGAAFGNGQVAEVSLMYRGLWTRRLEMYLNYVGKRFAYNMEEKLIDKASVKFQRLDGMIQYSNDILSEAA